MAFNKEEWIKSLRVGDTVAIHHSGWGRRGWTLTSIEKITPTGRINLTNGMKVNSNGWVRGDRHERIQPVTDEIMTEILRMKLTNKIKLGFKRIDFKKATTDQLSALGNLIEELPKEEEEEEKRY